MPSDAPSPTALIAKTLTALAHWSESRPDVPMAEACARVAGAPFCVTAEVLAFHEGKAIRLFRTFYPDEVAGEVGHISALLDAEFRQAAARAGAEGKKATDG